MQGEIGDCYFLSAVSCIAVYPELIQRIFRDREVQATGCYSIVLCVQGCWEEIILDDLFPCYGNKLAFASSNSQGIWPMLIEKAWAKANGSYDSIISGQCSEAFRAVTGACTSEYKIEDDNPEELFKIIYDSIRNNYLICCSSDSDLRSQILNHGLVSNHAYSILDIEILIVKDGKYIRSPKGLQETRPAARLIKIRNPWSRGEWKGKW